MYRFNGIRTPKRCFAVGQNLLSLNSTLRDVDGSTVKPADFFKGKKVVLLGVPGAFTPVCSNKHVPSFLDNLDKVLQKADAVACVSVNDHFVLKNWSESMKAKNIKFLADSDGSFVKDLKLDVNLGAAGLGLRSKRFTLVVDNGKITHENVEKSPADFTVTSADHLLKQLAETDKKPSEKKQ